MDSVLTPAALSPTEQGAVVFALVHLVVMGVSHVLAPRAWIDFFVRLRERGESGVFNVGLLSLGFGSVIVAFHNVWSGWSLVLTLLGWAQVTKAGLYFAFPRFGLRQLARVSPERPRDFVVAGCGLIVIACLVALPLLGL